MTFKAQTVADWILWAAAQNGHKLSPMQLQKHLYYAQGYSLGMGGEKLFDDPIVAWEHGPVVVDVYRNFRCYGGGIIPPLDNVEIPDSVAGIIDVVVAQKSHLPASVLRNATHEEMPYMSTPRNEEISPQKLEDFFTSMFWTSDEEDAYEPAFDTIEEQTAFFRDSLSQDCKKSLINACSI